MNPQLRQVRKLRLCSSDESLNRRGAILIEDALRTAFLPDSGGARVLVIRKLSLGQISASHAPASIAMRIESLCRDLEANAVHALSPEAIASPAVYFDDDLEPWVLLAVRIASGLPVGAWFWPLAARGWNSGMPRDEALRILLRGALASSAGPVAALSLMRAMVRHRAVGIVASALRHGDGQSLLQAFEWTAPARTLSFFPRLAERPADAPSTLLEEMALPWFSAWGADDARSMWLACVLYAIERPVLYTQPALLTKKAAGWIAASPLALSSERRFEKSNPLSSDDPLPPGQAPQELNMLPREELVRNSGASDVSAEIPKSETRDEEQIHSSGFRPRMQSATARAGLFYIVPVLHRLGMAQWLQSDPERAAWNIPYLVLRAIAERLETPPNDPVYAALGDATTSPPPYVQFQVQDWVRRTRRYLRRIAGIGMHSAVCRPGRLALTETHIDILFDIHRIDIRIRRAGLDIDPGWVPWLARVVLFHYVDLEDTHA